MVKWKDDAELGPRSAAKPSARTSWGSTAGMVIVALAAIVVLAELSSTYSSKPGFVRLALSSSAASLQALQGGTPPCEQRDAFANQWPGSTPLKDYSEIWETVYKPEGFCLCSAATSPNPCWLRLWSKVDCTQMFKDYLRQLETYTPVFPPPKEIPHELKDTYLLHGHATINSYYRNEEAGYKKGAPVPTWGPALFEKYMALARARALYGNYRGSMWGLYPAVNHHKAQVAGLSGAVFGSNDPWLEGLFFEAGAKHITTVEFRETRTTFPNHAAITPAQWARGWLDGSMREIDWVASFSSLEHDGLGRYGDPMNPWGDVETMQRLSCYVKQGGLAFIGVPGSSQDRIEFNAHRIYGPARWPLMTANWEVLGVYVQQDRGLAGRDTCKGLWSWLDAHARDTWAIHPVAVLRNTRTTPCQ